MTVDHEIRVRFPYGPQTNIISGLAERSLPQSAWTLLTQVHRPAANQKTAEEIRTLAGWPSRLREALRRSRALYGVSPAVSQDWTWRRKHAVVAVMGHLFRT